LDPATPFFKLSEAFWGILTYAKRERKLAAVFDFEGIFRGSSVTRQGNSRE